MNSNQKLKRFKKCEKKNSSYQSYSRIIEVQFLGCLQNTNVILGSDLAHFLKDFLKFLRSKTLEKNQKDHVAHIVMSCLTFVTKKMTHNCIFI